MVAVRIGPGEQVEGIGPYRVTGVLGRGGMGVVYEVVDTRTDAVRALKTVEARFLALPDSQAGRRFDQEIQVMAKLDHPGVVRLHDYGFAQHPLGYELAYFVMTKLEGRSLDDRLELSELFTPLEALRCIAQVCDALSYLEQHRVLHRDLKPANLFEQPDGSIVLMDFGLARSSEFTRLTRAGHVIGTLPYMSPEALRAEETSTAVDVYALGAVTFEMMLGAYPFDAQDPTALVDRIEAGLVWPSGAELTGPAAGVQALVQDMLQPEAADRPSPQAVVERATALRRALVGSPPAPRDTGTRSLVAPAAPAATAPRPEAEPTPAPLAAPNAPPWGPIAVTVTLSAGIAFAAGLWVGRATAPEAPTPPEAGARTPLAEPAPPVEPPPPAEPVGVDPQPTAAERGPPAFDDADRAFAWGDRALRDGRHQAAIAALERTLELNPAFATAHRRLGDAYLSLGELQDALRHYKIYKALRPTARDAAQVGELIRKVSRVE